MEDTQKQEEFYTMFMQRSREGIWRVDLEPPISVEASVEVQLEHLFKHAIIRDCNTVFAKMYGFASLSDIIGKPLFGFLTRTDQTNTETLRLFIRSGYDVYDVETHEVDKDGNPHWFLNNAVGVVRNGYLLRAYGVQQEITARRLIERERESLREKLPPRQRAILQLMADGHTTKEVASALNISEKTVHTHRERMMERLSIHDVSSLMQYAMRLGLSSARHLDTEQQ